MLAFLGFAMIFVFMLLIMTKRLSAIVALVLIPMIFALFGGFYNELASMMVEGIQKVAPTGIMLMFAILYFGIMIDSGLFAPLIASILKFVKNDPLKIVVGTALLTMLVSLDGDGTTTYIITVSAMLPLYKKLNMDKRILAAVILLSAGITNIIPWGGPTARVMSALTLDNQQLFVPLIPILFSGAIWVIFIAYLLGKKERRRLKKQGLSEEKWVVSIKTIKFPIILWINFTLTILLMLCLILNVMPLPIVFMIAFAIAMAINYPHLEMQKKLIAAHGGNALSVVSLVFAAGVFTGILSGTKMVDAMALSLVNLIPDTFGPHSSFITALTSMPFTFFMSNDAYYFGIIPILAKTAAMYGVTAAEIGRASLLGQPIHLLSPLVPSTYLLVGMAEVDFGELQKFTLLWAMSAVLIMITVGSMISII